MGRLFGKFIAGAWVQETPTGTVNGTNTAFTLSSTPAATTTLVLSLDGVILALTTDFTISGATVTMTTAPVVGQTLRAYYLKSN